MSFAEQLRSIYVSAQPSANTTYDTNIIFAGVYGAATRECIRQSVGNISMPSPVPTVTSDRGAWSATTSYIPGDGVNYLGANYGCITSNTNQPPPNAFWGVITPTVLTWQGAWSALTTYNYGDGITDLGVSYVCIQNNLNQQPPNTTYWAIYNPPTRSFTLDVTATTAAVASVTAIPRPEQGGGIVTWQGSWNNYTEYLLNDAVTFQGISYICSTPNINLAPSPPNAYWNIPLPNDPIYPYVPQTGMYVASSADLIIIRDGLIKKLTTANMGLTVVASGPVNITISW